MCPPDHSNLPSLYNQLVLVKADAMLTQEKVLKMKALPALLAREIEFAFNSWPGRFFSISLGK